MFNLNSNPKTTGSYTVLYSRAKSSERTVGTARYNARTKKWGSIKNNRTGRIVENTYDYRDDVIRTPKIVGWK